jgi:hypothetical protein
MQKRWLFLLVPLLAVGVAGCGGGVEPVDYTADTVAVPEADLGITETAEMDAAEAPPIFAIDFAAERPVGGDGEPVSDLALLNEALERLTMSYEDDGTGSEVPAKLRAVFQSIRDPNDLVRLRLIKSAPTPPAGKQYRMDSRTKQFTLVDSP